MKRRSQNPSIFQGSIHMLHDATLHFTCIPQESTQTAQGLVGSEECTTLINSQIGWAELKFLYLYKYPINGPQYLPIQPSLRNVPPLKNCSASETCRCILNLHHFLSILTHMFSSIFICTSKQWTFSPECNRFCLASGMWLIRSPVQLSIFTAWANKHG